MSAYVLDSSAILAHLGQERGGEVTRDLLLDPSAVCYSHAVNLCEVYYDQARAVGIARAWEAIESLFADGLIERKDMGRDFWKQVGGLKVTGRISLADCFCIALAQELGGEVVTCDHHEFDPRVPLGIVPIRFIR